MNAGMANDLLSTLCLATNAMIAIAPAMNEKMWLNPITQHNLMDINRKLPSLHVFGPAAGEQACGDIGFGRMLEPLELVERSEQLFGSKPLSGQKVVITAGPTQESIDPVRYLSNHSSGKMGYALADAAAMAGAHVVLISGPTALPTPTGVQRINVRSALEMLEASQAELENCDLFVGTAAVADYRPESTADHKLKKDGSCNDRTLTLVENPDIIASIANHAKRPKLVIAFAAETQNVTEYAHKKLTKKGVDAVVANDVSRSDIGFGSDTNEILWVTTDKTVSFGPASKKLVAQFIIEQLTTMSILNDA